MAQFKIFIGSYVPPSGGSANVTPDTASVILTAFAPTISVSNHQSVIPEVSAVTVTAFAPSVAVAGGPVAVTPESASVSITTYAPTVEVSGQQAPISGNPGWSHVWKRPLERKTHERPLQLVLTISSTVTTYRHHEAMPAQVREGLDQLKRTIIEEAETVLRRAADAAEQRRKDAEGERQHAEQLRILRQAADDDELVLAASVLLRDEPQMKWTIPARRRRYGRRS